MTDDGARRRARSRTANGALEPPFQLPGVVRGARAAASRLLLTLLAAQPPSDAVVQQQPLWHRFCPCSRFTPFGKLPAHLADNEFVLHGYRVVRVRVWRRNAAPRDAVSSAVLFARRCALARWRSDARMPRAPRRTGRCGSAR
jgi:hypothetical protein